MPKNLVIVESPAKAKTIEGYLGKEFKVKSSFGHVRDLPKGNEAIDIANGYLPRYEISPDKTDLIKELRKDAKEADMVWLATDDDREGEAISWHLKEALNLDELKTKRIVFREITKNAILRAIDQPRSIDMELVNAQQARRVLDRLVGFEISPVLWKKIRAGLSAGRVQSVAVRLIVDREREISNFKSESYFRTVGIFETSKRNFKAVLNKEYSNEADAQSLMQSCIGAGYQVSALEVKPAKKSPAPPFTTSSLQQEASRKLGISVQRTMALAQGLYEAGHITYMRTDSFNLSGEAIGAAKGYISDTFGEQYSQPRNYKTKSESAQEAHEAIRPTNFGVQRAGKDANEQRLYELIWKRAIASQMADARLERTIVHINISTNANAQFVATGEVYTFDGFMKVYLESKEENELDENEDSAVLPPLVQGQTLNAQQITSTERFTRPAARYTEALLVKKLEELGIGRPSTYAPTISTIQAREYVIKEGREGKQRPYVELTIANNAVQRAQKSETTGLEKNKLFPTDMGTIVNDFLVNAFPEIVDFSFTAQVENEFDQIAHGKMSWQGMIDNFYRQFHGKVEESEKLDRAAVNTARELGIHPDSGRKVLVRLSRFGPVAQIGESEEDAKPQYANLKPGQRMETITLEEALELFKLPRTIGTLEGAEMVVGAGRFGPYVRHDGKFYSLTKTDDPYTITEERAITLIEEKRMADANKVIKVFDENPNVKVLNGRWGPYIEAEGRIGKIPKDKEPAALTFQECMELAKDGKPTKAAQSAAKKAKAKPAKAAKPAKEKVPKAKASTAKKETSTKKAK